MRNVLTGDAQSCLLDREPGLLIRKATMHDIHNLLNLINGYAAEGIMLPRTEFEMSENIRDFVLAYDGARLAGCGALHFYSPTSGEVRSLAVDPNGKKRGVGRSIVEALEKEGREYGLHTLFAFTYVAKFFEKLGFVEVERGELPLKAWKDCLRCPKFHSCDETAMVKHLVDSSRTEASNTDVRFSGLLLPVLQTPVR